LVAIAKDIENNEANKAIATINKLREHYFDVVDGLIINQSLNKQTKDYITSVFDFLVECASKNFSKILENAMLAQGELLSTYMFNCYLQQEGVSSTLLPALDFMRIDKFKDPDIASIKKDIVTVIEKAPEAEIYITQGFICLDENSHISNLQRGGSDYSATIIGAVLKADEVQIWTDIDGMHNNDPRCVENTRPISNLSFDEAAELAYFGAKILHPQTVTPVREDNIPVRLKSTLNPSAYGTLISGDTSENGIKAIAAKDNITAIKIKSGRMLQAHGFLKKVFEIFEVYETSIDMITTSEVAVSLTIDDNKNLNKIISELEKFASIEVDEDQSIICLVGHSIVNHEDTYKMFQILQNVKIRMISYGGSNNNISLLVHSEDKINTLRKLNGYLFELVTL